MRLVTRIRRPWERVYGYGWDDALDMATRHISDLLASCAGQSVVPKSDLQRIADRLAHETERPK